MSNQSVQMVCADLRKIPVFPLPEGYRFRPFREGDDNTWTIVQRAAEPFIDIQDTLFEDQYGDVRDQLPARMWFVEAPDGAAVATISAWFESKIPVAGERGRIHWVAVHPDHQRRGISKAMMTLAMRKLAEHHDAALLGTSSGRPWAVKLYLDFGFLPDAIQWAQPAVVAAWDELQNLLDHPALAAFLAERSA